MRTVHTSEIFNHTFIYNNGAQNISASTRMYRLMNIIAILRSLFTPFRGALRLHVCTVDVRTYVENPCAFDGAHKASVRGMSVLARHIAAIK